MGGPYVNSRGEEGSFVGRGGSKVQEGFIFGVYYVYETRVNQNNQTIWFK